jgi:hypothetical protein
MANSPMANSPMTNQHMTNSPIPNPHMANSPIPNPTIKDPYRERDTSRTRNTNSHKNKNLNIIEEMMKPQIIVKENKDVDPNFIAIKKQYDEAKTKKGLDGDLKITNVPYKNIIRDKIINKPVNQIKEADLVVHKVVKSIDADIDVFNTESNIKNIELNKINEEVQVEFHIDNYDKHKKKYDFKETFIKNLAFEANTCDENKQDYIEFYRKKQKEAEEGKEICDSVLHKLIDTGLIKPEELPSDFQDIDLTNNTDSGSDPIQITNDVAPDIDATVINPPGPTPTRSTNISKKSNTISKSRAVSGSSRSNNISKTKSIPNKHSKK